MAEKKAPRGLPLDQRVQTEADRLRDQLEKNQIAGERIDLLAAVIENTAWMKCKLDDARKTISSGRIILKYDNGGGQKGSHANPAYAEYRALWAAYLKGLEKILEELPEEERGDGEPEEAKTVLGFILGKHDNDHRITEPAAKN